MKTLIQGPPISSSFPKCSNFPKNAQRQHFDQFFSNPNPPSNVTPPPLSTYPPLFDVPLPSHLTPSPHVPPQPRRTTQPRQNPPTGITNVLFQKVENRNE